MPAKIEKYYESILFADIAYLYGLSVIDYNSSSLTAGKS